MLADDADDVPTLTEVAHTDVLGIVGDFFRDNLGKIIWLVVVAVCAALLAKVLTKVLRKALAKAAIPNVSLFVNIMRVLVWTLAATLVLKPVFGISPTTVFTALGIGGLALSLGLKDSIANVISGFELMFGKVVKPGDVVTISGVTGVVEDISWRQTIVRARGGNVVIVPNSVLSTTAIQKLNPSNEALVKVPFTAKSGVDTHELSHELTGLVESHCKDILNAELPPLVKFSGLTPYGMSGEVFAYAKDGVALSSVADAVTRAISNCDELEQRAATGE
ncbi:mechanosensitive ion channel [Bifidobacterium sp. BRDM6]|uniref:Mechanosensitive ion channel n=2 Tax=Bifidobacterium choloepi TaxID=2614131 RepID=A0A6I5MYU0_9BIFI|nr:mechanosensitive ion channel [Bifidobacterium choloepi]